MIETGFVADPETAQGALQHPHIRSFGTRRGHLTAGQRAAFDNLQSRFRVPFAPEVLDMAGLFGNPHPVILEIGCGMGETTAAIAAATPTINYLGVEVYPAGLGALMARLDHSAISNVKVVAHDAVEILQHMIAPDSLAGCHIFFPDPWPKKRHHKRRLIQPPFVALLASRMRIGGVVHCATDWEPYAEQMRDVLCAEPSLANKSPDDSEGWFPRPAWRPVTKFEKRGLALGHRVRDLIFERIQVPTQSTTPV